ncbi:MAG TPA: ferredoxin [Verrucomicrobiae bacterium]|nr:ferredoxin [Verrucomicrobiae bacterium]
MDNTCIDCDMCRNIAPKCFSLSKEGSYSYVYRQPQTPEEIAEAEEARTSCPVESIGKTASEMN